LRNHKSLLEGAFRKRGVNKRRVVYGRVKAVFVRETRVSEDAAALSFGPGREEKKNQKAEVTRGVGVRVGLRSKGVSHQREGDRKGL